MSIISDNKVIKIYPAFREFYGMEEVIEQVVSYFRHAAQGLEERKQILYLLGPVGGGKSSIAEKLNAKRIAFFGPNDELGKNDAKALKAELEKIKAKGVTFAGEEYYERGSPDFWPALLRLICRS